MIMMIMITIMVMIIIMVMIMIVTMIMTEWGVDYSFDCTGNTQVSSKRIHIKTYIYIYIWGI